jgi:prepilin-type N-terminal cleavage/methylation domain-containing protein
MRARIIHRGAFTLIELLVVVAVISLLVSILTPMLTKAREVARRTVCLSNERNISEAAMAFATINGGRGPGAANLYDNSTGKPGSSLAWMDILNTEYYKTVTIMRMLGTSGGAPTGQLSCPDATVYGNRFYVRPYQWSTAALGTGDANQPIYSGLAVDPAKLNSLYRTSTRYLGQYRLGVLFESFRRTDNVFMMIESEHAGDSFSSPWPNTPASPVMNGPGLVDSSGNAMPPWGAGVKAPSDFFGFRHTLPLTPTLPQYQQQATACFSYLDGHVAIVNPNMDLDVKEHYALTP